MSLNYYQVFPGTRRAARHIGLASGGMFLFQAYPQQHLMARRDWLQALEEGAIVDEYDAPVSLAAFADLTASWQATAQANTACRVYHNSPVRTQNQPVAAGSRYRDAEGHCFANYAFS